MKKMLTILLALLIVVALVGCGHDATDATDATNATVATENVQQDQVRVEEETSETTLPMQEVETTPLFVCEYDTTLFYYNQLTSEEQEIYNLIEEKKYDFMSNTPVCILSELNGDLYEGYNPEIAVRALEAYQNDNPLSSIWLADTTVRFWAEVSYPEDGGYIIHEKGYYVAPYGFDYIEGVFNYVDVSGETREEMIAEVEQMISEVEAYTLEIVQTLEGDDHQKIEQINQWVINGCEYSLEGEHIRDVYGCLIEKHCCCAGDAMAVKYVADMAGLNVIVVSGLGITDDKTIEEVKAEFDEEEKEYINHAWNYVFTPMDGWTLMDSTWNRGYEFIPSGVYEDIYSPDGEYLGYGEKMDKHVVANDNWLFIDLNSDEAKATHVPYEGDNFYYPE